MSIIYNNNEIDTVIYNNNNIDIVNYNNTEVFTAGKALTIIKGDYITAIIINGSNYYTDISLNIKPGTSVTLNCNLNNTEISGNYKYIYSFVNWTGYTISTNKSFTFTMPDENITYTANGSETMVFNWPTSGNIPESTLLSAIENNEFETSLVGRLVTLNESSSTHNWRIIRVNTDSYDLWYEGSIGVATSGYSDSRSYMNKFCTAKPTGKYARGMCISYKSKLSSSIQSKLMSGLNTAASVFDKVVILSSRQLMHDYNGSYLDANSDSNNYIDYFTYSDNNKRKISLDYWTSSVYSGQGSLFYINTNGICYSSSSSSTKPYTDTTLNVVPAIRVGNVKILTENELLTNINNKIFDTSLVGNYVRLKEGSTYHNWKIIRVNTNSYDLWYEGSIGKTWYTKSSTTGRIWNNISNDGNTDYARGMCISYKSKLSSNIQNKLIQKLNLSCGDDVIVVLSSRQLGRGDDIVEYTDPKSNTYIPYFNGHTRCFGNYPGNGISSDDYLTFYTNTLSAKEGYWTIHQVKYNGSIFSGSSGCGGSTETKNLTVPAIRLGNNITEDELLSNIENGIFDPCLVGSFVSLKEGNKTHNWRIIRVNTDSYDLWYDGSIGVANWNGVNTGRYWTNQSSTTPNSGSTYKNITYHNPRYLCTQYKSKLSDNIQSHLKTRLNRQCGNDLVVILSARQLGYGTWIGSVNDIPYDSNTWIEYFNSTVYANDWCTSYAKSINGEVLYWTTSPYQSSGNMVMLMGNTKSNGKLYGTYNTLIYDRVTEDVTISYYSGVVNPAIRVG